MNSKFLVPFETAQLLKEKGYPQENDSFQECDLYYYDDGELEAGIAIDTEELDDCFYAPTYHEVLDWLKEKYNFIVCVRFSVMEYWSWIIVQLRVKRPIIYCKGKRSTREEALNEGILKALEMI